MVRKGEVCADEIRPEIQSPWVSVGAELFLNDFVVCLLSFRELKLQGKGFSFKKYWELQHLYFIHQLVGFATDL